MTIGSANKVQPLFNIYKKTLFPNTGVSEAPVHGEDDDGGRHRDADHCVG